MSTRPDAFAVITAATILPLIRDDLSGCIAVVRDAYLAQAEGRGVNPRSVFMRFADRPDCRIIALPSHLGAPWRTSGLKWVASYPANVERGIPRASAVLLLNDHDFGHPFACLEGSVISAARTAASAVLAASHLRSGDHHVGTLGCTVGGESDRPLPGELSIEMLTRAAERLAFFGRFDAQPLGMFAADPLKEPLVKIVAIAGDFW